MKVARLVVLGVALVAGGAAYLLSQSSPPTPVVKQVIGPSSETVDVLVAKCVLALQKTGMTRLVIAGGVGANKQLREALGAEAKRRGFDLYYPEPELCTDNGAMIAFAASLHLKNKPASSPAFTVKPRWDLAAG